MENCMVRNQVSHPLKTTNKIVLCMFYFIMNMIACGSVWVLNLVSESSSEEHRLRVFGNRMLRRIYGPKRDEVTGEWKELYNEELHDLYSSPSIIRIMKSRRMRLAEHVARMGEKKNNEYRLLVGKPEGKRPLGRPRRRWVDNIRMDLVEVEWSDVDWIGLAQDRDR
jgi:PAS domain-containing protein